jgi:hypothetical protein
VQAAIAFPIESHVLDDTDAQPQCDVGLYHVRVGSAQYDIGRTASLPEYLPLPEHVVVDDQREPREIVRLEPGSSGKRMTVRHHRDGTRDHARLRQQRVVFGQVPWRQHEVGFAVLDHR